jgi:hypothetical protein
MIALSLATSEFYCGEWFEVRLTVIADYCVVCRLYSALLAHGCGDCPFGLVSRRESANERCLGAPYVKGSSFESNQKSRPDQMFRLNSSQEGTSIQRRELLVGGLAGVVGCAFPRLAPAATVFVLPTAAADPTIRRPIQGYEDRHSYSLIFVSNR